MLCKAELTTANAIAIFDTEGVSGSIPLPPTSPRCFAASAGKPVETKAVRRSFSEGGLSNCSQRVKTDPPKTLGGGPQECPILRPIRAVGRIREKPSKPRAQPSICRRANFQKYNAGYALTCWLLCRHNVSSARWFRSICKPSIFPNNKRTQMPHLRTFLAVYRVRSAARDRSGSIHGAAARNIEHRAGRERAVFRTKPGDQRRDLVDLDEAVHWNFRQHVVDVLPLHLRKQFGLRRRRRHAIH